MNKPPTVALVEWNAAGHHRTYFAAFASAMLKMGSRVIPLCPWPNEVSELVSSYGEDASLDSGVLEKAQCLYWPTASWVRPIWLRDRLVPLKLFRNLGRKIKRWERDNGTKVDLVFFSCIYDWDFKHFALARRFLPFPLSGLYLDCRAFRVPGSPHPATGEIPHPEKLFALPGWRSVGTLDEGSVKKLSDLAGGLPCVWFPDVADTRMPSDGSADGGLGAKIRNFANGRKVIGCVGHLQKSKGVLELIRVSSDPRLQDFCFAFVGEVNWYSFTDEEKGEILRAWESCERIFVHPLRVPDGPRLNGAIAACDIIAAAYLDFPNSSNMLTKAAAFGIPIVVNDQHLMAERVKRFSLGRVIPEGCAGELAFAILELGSGSEVEEEKRLEFLALHAQDEVEKAFFAIVGGKSRPMPDSSW